MQVEAKSYFLRILCNRTFLSQKANTQTHQHCISGTDPME